MAGQVITDVDIAVASEAVRRYVSRQLHDRSQVDDVCQEAMARLLRARGRLDPAAATPYAMTVAKNIILADARKADVARRHAHRIDSGSPLPSPEDLAVQRAEAAAVSAALHSLPADERDELLAHVIEGEPTAALANRSGGTAGGIAARLARTRARMRVDYLVAARRSTLPSERCHPVLLALSAGDRRRQRALGAADHLTVCETCASLAPPLLERQRSLVGLVPIPALATVLGRLRSRATAPHVIAASAVAGVVVVAAVIFAANTQPARPRSPAQRPAPAPAPAPAQPSPLDFGNEPALPILRVGTAHLYVGRPVTARHVVVESVPADEGFWIEAGDRRRVWVELRTGSESPVKVTSGSYVSLTGTLSAHGPEYPQLMGVDAGHGAAELAGLGVHVDVDPGSVKLTAR